MACNNEQENAKMLKILSLVFTFALFTTACANEQVLPAGQPVADSVEPSAEPVDTLLQLENAWRVGREQGKPVLVVLRSDGCDRCALLHRYMQEEALRVQLDSRFVVLDIDVGIAVIDSQGESSEERLPAIVLVDTRQEFAEILATDQLVTFLPSADESLYDWMENILHYSAQTLAFH